MPDARPSASCAPNLATLPTTAQIVSLSLEAVMDHMTRPCNLGSSGMMPVEDLFWKPHKCACHMCCLPITWHEAQ